MAKNKELKYLQGEIQIQLVRNHYENPRKVDWGIMFIRDNRQVGQLRIYPLKPYGIVFNTCNDISITKPTMKRIFKNMPETVIQFRNWRRMIQSKIRLARRKL